MQDDLEFAARPDSNEKNKKTENKETIKNEYEKSFKDANVDSAGNRYEEIVKEFDFEQAAREDY